MDSLSFMFFSANFFVLMKLLNASDAITSSRSLSDESSSTLVSADGSFELGFFTPGSSSNRYVGIWYRNIPVRTVVWVANRQNPINDSSGLFMIDNIGNLVLVGRNQAVFWSTNSTKLAQNPVVELLDSGNLVLRDKKDDNEENYLWQSFDYPTDTLLPGMKVGINLKTGIDRRLISWKSWDDPSPGYFYWKVQPHNNPDSTMWKGSSIFFRTGPWNGISYSGTPYNGPNSVYTYTFVNNGEEIYYAYYQKSKSIPTRLVVNPTNNRSERFTWHSDSQSWKLFSYLPVDYCDTYALCGANGICTMTDSPLCRCLKGFKPKLPEKWNNTDWTDGCVRNKSLDCHGDGFVKFRGLKLPDTTHSWVNKRMDMKQCRAKCLENCSCSAYSNIDVRNGGSGCAIWFNDLIDIKLLPAEAQDIYIQDLYIRMSASQLAEFESAKSMPSKKIIVITIAVIVGITGVLVTGYYFCRTKRRVKENKAEFHSKNDGNEEDLDLALFDFSTISNATNEFAPSNKLGEGGFGPVYKGALSGGQEIAVKRLSRNSGQGFTEFKNEVILIAKLQHRSLVKLLGCCIEGEERLLIYEFMPNKSLDAFIFDKRRAELLDWSTRFNIICGIARGLLYLHQDSRLRIIHRDLKASNVLLDNEMNPKISDFGMARIFGGDQIEGNTQRVVGTYGYMAPEYAIDGLFSIKSDVFSFGIMMLEIISGKKSRGFYHPNHSINLIGYAWRLWKEGNSSELIDSFLRESSDSEEVTRCLHISLLCVQHHVEDRPSMSSVIWMLSSENCALPLPKEPGFCKDIFPFEVNSSSGKIASTSTGEMSITMLEPR